MQPFRSEPRVFRRASAILGESLIAGHDATLRWCDITAGLLHSSPLSGQVGGADDTAIALPAPLASFHPALIGDRAGFVASLGDTVVLVDDAGTLIRELAVIDHVHSGLRLNEGKVDPKGRWVTGSMNLMTGEPDGAFYSVDASGGLRTLIGGIAVGNGLEWSADGARIYFTDTGASTVYTGAYSAAGEISEVEVFLDDGPHDGLARAADGTFWGALYGEGEVVVYSAAGVVLARVALPVPNVTSVAFGGQGLSTLFVTSARENLTEQQLVGHPLSGSVFAIETETHGFWPRTFVSAG